MRFLRFWTNARRWELALLIGISVTVLAGLWLEHEQSALADSVLRLHVLANSDSEADQALKLKVRDRVLEEAAALLPQSATVDEAERVLTENLERLAACGAQVVAQEGGSYPVTAQIVDTWFPTKEYDGFALPAGEYRALRIVIGEGEGQNWWCVVFPTLCLGPVSESAQDTALEAGMEARQVALLTGESEGYVIKFKALELWDRLKTALD